MKYTLVTVVIVYLIVSFMFMLAGIGNGKWPTHSADCKDFPVARIDYLLPSYKLGCWLGQTPD